MQINKLLLLIAGIAGVAFAVPDTEVTVTTHPIKPDPPRGCPADRCGMVDGQCMNARANRRQMTLLHLLVTHRLSICFYQLGQEDVPVSNYFSSHEAG
ncbi:hypothetical protein MGG_15539 [Pyricularia oryzae 70-15]|uniref:Uncharacterized protein n=1 Tax=Pyricularia oryzae (strain 70-15 / ATCC MYA-4617 / FGSC 8958) TaxID=242507 RepID=G4MZG3_PYRO7|nr:uncharacterized protein MGG_15539 [Pyricularia oryzae 70-15]EHA53718.1 hypothetical protein MGG_15539 [Pyricularia oryzae 70-15]